MKRNLLLNYVANLSNELGIIPPKVKINDKHFRGTTKIASLESDGNYCHLYVRNNQDDVELLFAIAHELRHKYQIDNGLFNFDNYKSSSDISIRDYNLQPVEIDANAFAYMLMKDEFNIEMKFNGLDKDIIELIKRRADIILKNEY